jgi:hypothetical protein
MPSSTADANKCSDEGPGNRGPVHAAGHTSSKIPRLCLSVPCLNADSPPRPPAHQQIVGTLSRIRLQHLRLHARPAGAQHHPFPPETAYTAPPSANPLARSISSPLPLDRSETTWNAGPGPPPHSPPTPAPSPARPRPQSSLPRAGPTAGANWSSEPLIPAPYPPEMAAGPACCSPG